MLPFRRNRMIRGRYVLKRAGAALRAAPALGDYTKSRCGLPKLGAELGSKVHSAAGLDAEGFEELGDMRQGGVDAVLGQTVHVGSGELELGLFADVAGPYSGVGKEETLGGCEAVHLLLVHLTLGKGVLQGLVADVEATVVGNVLAKGELAVGIGERIVANFHLVEPVNKHLSIGLEAGGILVLPPVVQVAVLVVVAALVIEAVGHFVSNHHTDGTIVESVVGIHVEEGFLQDTGGEADLVGGGIVVGVDGLRSHAPFGLVDGLVNLGDHVGNVELVGADDVGEVAVVLDFETAIVTPLVGITHLDHDGGEFLDGALLGALAHPFGIVDTHGKSLLQIVDHLHHTVFGLRGEEACHVELAKGLTHGTVDGAGDAKLALTKLLLR